jgi:biotin transport system substrate-specific component
VTTDAATLRAAVLPRSSVVTDTALVLGGAAFIALCAQVVVHVPQLTPVPFTLQTFAVLASGAALGSARGGLATLLYLLVGMAGLPVFAEASSGVSVVFGATGGYLVGMVLAAVLVGALAERRGMDRRVHTSVVAMVTGAALTLAVGTVWLAAVMDISLSKAVALGVTPFLVVEALKVAAATVALPTAWKLLSLVRK